MSPPTSTTGTTFTAAASTGTPSSPSADNSSNDEENIKTMQLYTDIERIDNELRARGIDDGTSGIDPRVLSKIDSMHYEGDDAIMAAIRLLNLSPTSTVLDIGSGFGGPARLLAAEAKCRVLAMELQEDIHDKASELTRRCKLNGLVSHSHADILHCDTSTIGNGPGSFDAVVSWLVFLHIPDKKALFTKCNDMLKEKGGKLFTDDFYMLSHFTEKEERSLKEDVYCANLSTKNEYIKQLEDCGFYNIKFEDRTEAWTKYVNDRAREFVAARENFSRVHGRPTYEHLLHFYTAIVDLFNSGNLGGVRIFAEKKS